MQSKSHQIDRPVFLPTPPSADKPNIAPTPSAISTSAVIGTLYRVRLRNAPTAARMLRPRITTDPSIGSTTPITIADQRGFSGICRGSCRSKEKGTDGWHRTAVVVMIGRQRLKIKDKSRRRRLDNEDDLVRAEIAAALQQTIPVIPVLVEDAKMPNAADLLDNIRLLARRTGMELSATRWKSDVERLIKELDRVMKPSSAS